MPNTTDYVLDNVVVIDNLTPFLRGDDMATTLPAEIHEQNLTRLAQAGINSHEHHNTFGKILDLNYEMDRKMVSLVQSLGVREVTSQSGQLGIPNAAQVGHVGTPSS